jgi:hypothetical protein
MPRRKDVRGNDRLPLYHRDTAFRRRLKKQFINIQNQFFWEMRRVNHWYHALLVCEVEMEIVVDAHMLACRG